MSNMDALRECMKAKEVTHEALANLLQVSTSLVGHWLAGRRALDPERCPAIEAAIGVRCEELMPNLEWVRDAAGVVTHYQVPVVQQIATPAPSASEQRAA